MSQRNFQSSNEINRSKRLNKFATKISPHAPNLMIVRWRRRLLLTMKFIYDYAISIDQRRKGDLENCVSEYLLIERSRIEWPIISSILRKCPTKSNDKSTSIRLNGSIATNWIKKHKFQNAIKLKTYKYRNITAIKMQFKNSGFPLNAYELNTIIHEICASQFHFTPFALDSFFVSAI